MKTNEGENKLLEVLQSIAYDLQEIRKAVVANQNIKTIRRKAYKHCKPLRCNGTTRTGQY